MKLHMGMAGAICLVAAALQAAETKPAAKGDPRAAALLQESARTRYTWSPAMTGVSGKFTWEQDGQSGSGQLHAIFHKRGGVKVEADGGAALPADVKDHVASMIMHRVPLAPGAAERPPAPAVIVVEDDERGPLIMTLGDPLQSTERVKDGKLVQVNRTMGGKRFTIDVKEFKNAEGNRVYPAAFSVTWWDAATGKKVEKQVYSTLALSVVDGQLFPEAEKVVTEKQGKGSTLVLHYRDIKFTSSQPAATER